MKCILCGSRVKKLDTKPVTFRGEVFIGVECVSCNQRFATPKPTKKPRKKKESVNGPDSNNPPTDSR